MNFTVKNNRSQTSFVAHSDQDLLCAALEAGHGLPHSCRAGNCGSCKAYLLEGNVSHQAFSSTALNDTQYNEGQILLCRAMAQSDLVIDIEEFTEQLPAASYWPTRILEMNRLTDDVMRKPCIKGILPN